MQRINENEVAAFYTKYIELSEANTIAEGLSVGLEKTSSFFKSLPSEKHHFQYEVGKWSPLDILQHLIDAERIFAYRALRIARLDTTALPGFEENDYANIANANQRTMKSLLEEYEQIRKSTICLYESFSDEVMLNSSLVNGNLISTRAIGWIICGHEIHHVNVIKERYLK
jgi:hypothetical protein